MEFVLNEFSRTVHKREADTTDGHTVCGVSRTLDSEKLQPISVELASDEDAPDRCGRCFEGEGGY